MQNFMKTILSAIRAWIKREMNLVENKITASTADWNQNDPNADNYVKNRTHWTDENGIVHKLDKKYLDLPDNIATTDDVESAKQEVMELAEEAHSIAEEAHSAAEENASNLITLTTTMIKIPFSSSVVSVKAYGDNKFVAIARGLQEAAYSFDGINWKLTSLPLSANWNYVCYGDDKFVAVADNTNYVIWSKNGIKWELGMLPVATNWNSICYGDGKFIAVGNGVNTPNCIAYSEDCINWEQATFPDLPFSAVCYGDGKFVALSSLYNMYGATRYSGHGSAYSEDGIVWTQTSLQTGGSFIWENLTYANNKFIAVQGLTHGNLTAYSDDGITWISKNLPESDYWHAICHNNDIVVLYGSNNSTYSYDGVNWRHLSSHRGNKNGFCYGDGKAIASYYNEIYYYEDFFSDVFTNTILTNRSALFQNDVEITDQIIDLIPSYINSAAKEGQILSVKSVDDTGRPVEWETVDENFGGGSIDEVYILSDGETLDNVPEGVEIVIDPDGDPDFDFSGFVQKTELQGVIDTALAQAKESGEFDGKDGVVQVTGATVGQTVKISAVDENGVPTAWESVDFPSGGGEENWEFINYVKLTEDSGLVTFNTDANGNPFCLKSVTVGIYSVGASTNTKETYLKVVLNDVLAMDNQTGIRNPRSARGCIYVNTEITKNIKTKPVFMFGQDGFNPVKNGATFNSGANFTTLKGDCYNLEFPEGVSKISITTALPNEQILGIDSEILIWGVRM